MTEQRKQLVDRFGRVVDYIRISITDRCDFRCVYCMDEVMTFLPRSQILSLEEIYKIASAFVSLGVRKIRLTGGEPLIRKDVMWLIERLGQLSGLDELVLTTNGSQLTRLALPLANAGVKRINISLDSLNPEKFRQLTRTGDLGVVLDGIESARSAGFKNIKLNAVVMKGRNDDEILDLVEYARERSLDLTFIEEMPLGNISEHCREEAFCSSEEVRSMIRQRYELQAMAVSTGGPSRYYRMPDSDSRIGFISPHSHNFCDTCNRVRLTVEGLLLLCLGNEHSVDLKAVVRAYPEDADKLSQAIVNAMAIKPERHYFDNSQEPQILRFMNMTGG